MYALIQTYDEDDSIVFKFAYKEDAEDTLHLLQVEQDAYDELGCYSPGPIDCDYSIQLCAKDAKVANINVDLFDCILEEDASAFEREVAENLNKTVEEYHRFRGWHLASHRSKYNDTHSRKSRSRSDDVAVFCYDTHLIGSTRKFEDRLSILAIFDGSFRAEDYKDKLLDMESLCNDSGEGDSEDDEEEEKENLDEMRYFFMVELADPKRIRFNPRKFSYQAESTSEEDESGCKTKKPIRSIKIDPQKCKWTSEEELFKKYVKEDDLPMSLVKEAKRFRCKWAKYSCQNDYICDIERKRKKIKI